MKKLIILAAAFFGLTTTALWAQDMYIQGGVGLGTNIIQIQDSHSLEFKSGKLFLGYKGFHIFEVMEEKDDDGNPIVNKNYDTYIPSLFLGFHADEFYFSVGGQLARFMWVEYNSNFSIPLFYPTVTVGWDIPVYMGHPHYLILNLDLSWFYTDLGDSYDQYSKNAWMFIPKFSIGAKYRFGFGRD